MKIVTAYRGIIKNAGFSLMELIISMGILMVLIGVLTTLFGQILDVQLESQATSSVDQNGRFIMVRLTHDMQSASEIVTPEDPGDETDTLQITVNSVDYIYTLDSNGNLLLTQNSQSDQLNNDAVRVSGLSFTRIGNGDSNDTVRVEYTLTTKSQQLRGIEEKSFQTTLGLH
jgi:hypothetical protein